MTPDEKKLTVACISIAAYARYVELNHRWILQEQFEGIEEADYRRLSQWWNNLGEDQKNKVQGWILAFSRDVEDVVGRVGRKKLSEWGPSQ
jgi:hypothetical protein